MLKQKVGNTWEYSHKGSPKFDCLVSLLPANMMTFIWLNESFPEKEYSGDSGAIINIYINI